MKKIYSLIITLSLLVFFTEKTFAQGANCSTAEPFCTAVGSPFSYNNVTGVASTSSAGCLSTTPNQTWFYIKTSAAGAMTYSLTQSSVAPGGTADLDVDFIAYGPYTAAQYSVACATLLTGTCTADHACSGNIEDCSYSIASTETMTLVPTAAGQYFIIMITNYENLPGYITFTQSGGAPSDCSIACPPNNFTLVGSLDSDGSNLPNGSTVNCSEPFWIDPPDLTPAGVPYNPFTDQLTPCMKVQINPLTAQVKTGGDISVYEGGTEYWAACTGTCSAPVGGTSAAGSQFGWYLGQVDPNFTHPSVFCRSAPLGATTPTVQLMSCWNNTLVLAGPANWSSTACFTLTAPTGTANYGSASFSIAPATGSVGIVDLNWGKAYVDPSFLPAGTTYTVTYTFNNGICGNLNGFYVFTVPTTPTISAITSQSVCSGAAVAATNFTVTPSAGATVSWTNNNTAVGIAASGTTNIAGYTAPTVTATTTGVVTVSSVSNGCTGNPKTFTITINPKPSANAGSTGTLTCSNTTLSLSGSGGGTYSWTGPSITSGSNTATPVVGGPGTYSLVTTSTAGCTSTVATVAISQNTTAPSPTASNSATLTCATSTVALTGGPAAGVTYQWSGPGFSGGTTSQNAVATAAGTYTLKVTSAANGCTNTAVTTVAQNTTAPSPTASNSTTLTCTNTTAALTGGPGSGVTYQWSGPGFSGGTTSQNATATAPGTYTLVVTSTANSCTAAATAAVTQNTTAPSPTASNSTTLTCTTTTAALTGGPGAGVTYQWSGPGFSGGTTSQNAVGTAAGTYTLVVTSTANSCTAAATTVLTQNASLPSPTASNSTTLTCTTTTAALTGGPGAGVTYQWSGPGFSGGTTSQNAVATAPGTYTLVVTNTANSCTAAATAAVTQNTTAPSPTASNSTTLTCATTTAALTGGPAAGVTYQWNGPGFSGGTTSQNAVGTAPGTYSLLVTSTTNGCTNTAVTTVSQNTTAPSPTASNSTTLSCTTTTAALTGGPAAGVTYQWSGPGFSGGTTSQNAVGTLPGTYTLVVTSTANSCTAAATAAVTQNTTAPSPTASNSTTLSCTTTTAALTGGPAAGVTYQWSGPGFSGGTTSQNAVGTAPGTYTLKVTSSVNGCTNTAVTTVTQNTTTPSPTASNSTTLTCTTTTAALTGGPAAGVTYQWSGPGFSGGTTSQNAVGTAPGTYTLKVTDAVNSCTAQATTVVTQNTTAPVPSAANSTTLTCSTSTAALTGGPAAGVTYQWSGPGFSGGTTSQNAVGTAPGTYTLVVTSTANSCTASATAAVTQNTTAPATTASNSTTLSCTNLTAPLTGGPGAGVTYQWSGPGFSGGTTSQNATGTAPGTYTLIATSTVNSCTAAATTAVTQNTVAPSVTMPATQTITCASPTVSLIGSANPTTCTPVWTGGACGGAGTYTATACSPNTYTLTVTNPVNGCSVSGTVSVVPSVGTPVVNASNTGSITCTNTSVQVSASTTMTPVSYSWTGPGAVAGASTSTGTVTVGGTYQCVVTNTSTGCTSTVTTVVPSNTTAVAASIAPTSTLTCTTTSLVLNASPTGSYSYSWTPAAGLSGTSVATPTVTQGGVYSVTITNTASGCVGNANITVASNTTAPTVNIGAPSVTTTCSNPTVTIVATSTPSTGVTYSWTSPGSGSLSNSSISNPVASGSGIFTVVVTNTASGCSSSATQNTVQVTPDLNVPVATLSANSLSITCSNPTVTTVASTTSSPVSYSWSPSAGIVPGTETTANPVFNSAGSYSLVVTNSTSGCASSINSNVVDVTLDNTIPVITLTSGANNGTITCTNTFVTISPTVAPTSNLTYTWMPSGVTSSTINDATFTSAGVYTLAVTNTVTGCVTSSTNTANTFTVIANNTSPTFTLGTAPSVTATCAVPSVTLSGSSNADPNSVYTWTTPSSSTMTGNPITVSNPGIYTVAVTNTVNGCSSSSVSQNTVEVVADAGIPVVTLSANSVSITCSNPTPSVAVSTTATPVTYSWSPTTGIVPGTETTANPVFNAAGSYSVVVTNTASGCASGLASNVVNVTLDNSAPSVTLSSGVNNGTITCTNTFVTISPTVTPSSNLTYTWMPGGVTSSTINDATFTAAGIYTLAVTNTLTGCVTSMTNAANSFTVIADNATPSFTLGTAPSVTTSCANPSATLSASSNADPNSVYTWTTPATSTVTGNPLVVSATGIYSVVVTNTVNGCSTSATTPATVEVLPGAGVPSTTLSSNSATITCSDPTPSITITTTASPVSYSWSPTTGIVPGTETTATPVFNAAGSYSAVVTNTTSGCSTSISGNVVTVTQDNTIPVITLSAGGNTGVITCANPQVTITPVVTPTANLTYTWSPSGVTSTAINDATFTASGVYTLAVTNTLTGCVSVSTNTANIFTVTTDTTVPTASINVTSANTSIGCGASSATVTLDGSGSTSANSPVFGWLPGPTAGSTLGVTTAGTYTLVVVDAVNGCADSTQITVTGNTITPQGVTAGSAANIACGSTSVTLNGATTTTNTSYSWAGPSGTSILSGGTSLNPTVTEVGDYTLTVTDNVTGCSSTSTVNVTQATATASITANPTTGISPLSVDFTGAGAGTPLYSWNFGDGNVSSSQNPNNTFTTGTYTVTLTTISGSCTATATVEIVVEDAFSLEIPNVFTPNGDGANDLFTIKSTGVKEIALQVFNRWGEKLYEFTGAKASWDGKAPNSANVPEGTYFYFVKATGFDGSEVEKHGTVNLFR